MKKVLIESPFAGDVGRNVDYAKRAMVDSLARGEAPFASHLLYTQTGILDDLIEQERARGVAAGLAWGDSADLVAVYADLGISSGMEYGIDRHRREGREVEIRYIGLLPELEEDDDDV